MFIELEFQWHANEPEWKYQESKESANFKRAFKTRNSMIYWHIRRCYTVETGKKSTV